MAGLGFDVQDGSGFKNKQGKQPTFAEAIAGNQTAQNLVNSPAASAVGTLAKGAAAGVAALPAAAMDVSNNAGNVVNYALGGDPNYFSTDNTKQALSIAGPGSSSMSAAVPTASASSMVPQMAASHTQVQPIAGGIQQTGQGQQTPPQPQPIAGVTQFTPSGAAPLGAMTGKNADGTTFNNNVRMNQGNINDSRQIQNSINSDTAARQNAAYKDAMDHQTIGQHLLAVQSNNTTWDLPKEQQIAMAKANFDAQEKNNGNASAQKIAGIGLEGHKYTADQQLAGQQVNADSHVKVAQIAGDAGVVKAKQTAEAKAAEQGQKDYTDRVKSLVGDWSKLNLPKEYVPKLNEFARIYADAENPNGQTFLLPPNREGGMYAALPKQYETQYNKLLQSMPHKDAAARVYGIAQQNGHIVANLPDFRRFMPTNEAIKQQNNNVIAGA